VYASGQLGAGRKNLKADKGGDLNMTIINEIAGDREFQEMHYGADTSGRSIDCIPNLIRQRAYQLFEARGRRQDHEVDDWLQAEREIKHHLGL
jgi:hypothetical protein